MFSGLIVATVGVLSQPLQAQPIGPERLVVRRPGHTITAVAQDSRGFLWVGSENGLARFDGRVFESSDADPQLRRWVADIAIAPDDSVWVLSRDAAVALHLDGSKVTRVGLPDNKLARVLVVDGDGVPWVGGDHGVAKLASNGSVWQPVARDGQAQGVDDMVFTPDGVLWVGTLAGIGRKGDGDWWWSEARDHFRDLFVDHKRKRVLAATSSGYGVAALSYDGAVLDMARGRSAFAVAATDAGDVWLGLGYGAYAKRAGDDQFLTALQWADLPSGLVRHILAGKRGNVWLATDAGGLIQVRPPRPFFTLQPGGGLLIFSVAAAPDGAVWMTTGNNALVRYHNNSIQSFRPPDGVYSLRGLLVEDENTVLVGSMNKGIWRLRDGAFEGPIVTPVVGALSMPLVATADGAAWFGVGADHLLLRQDGQIDRRFPLEPMGVTHPVVAAAEQGDAMWFATRGSGALRMHAGHWQRFTTKDGLPSNNVVAFHADSKGLWLGTSDAGLVHFDGQAFRPVSIGDGFESHTVGAIVDDDAGNYWMTSNLGVFRARIDDLHAFVDGKLQTVPVTRFTTRDGLPNNVCFSGYPNSGVKDSLGRIWAGTHRGAVAFIKPDKAGTTTIPPVYVDGVSLDGRLLAIDAGAVQDQPVGRGNLQFTYNIAMFNDRDKLRFRYRLHGLEKDWHDVGDRQQAYYAHLPAGSYQFELVAFPADSNSDAERSRALLTVVLTPPFYRTMPFYAGVIALLVLATLWVFRLRARLLSRRFGLVNEERNRIAREIHDSLEQTLFAAKLQVEAAEAEVPAPDGPATVDRETLEDHLDRARTLVEQSIDETRAAVWSLRTGVFGRADLAQAIRVTANTALQGSSVAFEQETQGTPWPMPAKVEWHLGRIVRESITNALKHAEASLITVDLNYASDAVSITVHDNGKGFSKETLTRRQSEGHYGVRGMGERIKPFGGSVEIESAPGQGTEVRVVLKRNSRWK